MNDCAWEREIYSDYSRHDNRGTDLYLMDRPNLTAEPGEV
jgi:hypothetical protein